MIYYFGNAFVFMKCKFYWVKLRAAMKKSLDFLIEIFSHRDLKWFMVVCTYVCVFVKRDEMQKNIGIQNGFIPNSHSYRIYYK